MDGCFFTCFVTLSVGKGVPSQKGIHFEGHEVEELASTAMTCSYFLQFLSESCSFSLGYIIPGVSENAFVWNLDECDLTVEISTTKRYCEVLVKDKMMWEGESCFYFKSLSITPTSLMLPVHTSLTTRREKEKKRKNVVLLMLIDSNTWDAATAEVTVNWPDMMVSVMLRLFRDRPRDWREEDEDVLEVSEGGRAALTGVAVGVALPLDLSRSFSALSVSISFCVLAKDWKRKKKEFQRLCKSASAAESDFTAWAGLCCYSESVLFKWKAISAFFIFKALFVVKAEAQIRRLIHDPQIWGETIGFCRQGNPTSAEST